MNRDERRKLIAARAELVQHIEAETTEARDPYEDRVEAPGETSSTEARRAMGMRGGRRGGLTSGQRRRERAPAPLRWKPHP